eukprot:TRINITY_DN13638_c0_g1_i4.p1 TRINITY_DN13638_c0_g1~~TRINITY_DN13638_c0_g1_i4.p1  ORF type:complete len:501 (+),score=96.92 TRINITY_DN13638_c0_g1_i4:615-2117(+)
MEAKQLEKRLHCIRVALEQLPAGSERDAVSNIQIAAWVSHASPMLAKLSADDKAGLATRAASLSPLLHTGGLQQILSLLHPMQGVQLGAKLSLRRPLQDYDHMLEYFTSSDWATMLSPEMSSDCILQVMLDRMIALGLRLPKEHSTKLLASCWMFTSEEKPFSIQPAMRREMMLQVSRQLKRRASLAPDPIQFIDTLPVSPAMLMHSAPELYHSAYLTEPPVPCKVDAKAVRAFDNAYGCRSSKASNAALLSSQIASHGKAPSDSAAADCSSVERMGMMIMKSMQDMQMQQARMFNAALGLESSAAAEGSIDIQFMDRRKLKNHMPATPRQPAILPDSLSPTESVGSAVAPPQQLALGNAPTEDIAAFRDASDTAAPSSSYTVQPPMLRQGVDVVMAELKRKAGSCSLPNGSDSWRGRGDSGGRNQGCDKRKGNVCAESCWQEACEGSSACSESRWQEARKVLACTESCCGESSWQEARKVLACTESCWGESSWREACPC